MRLASETSDILNFCLNNSIKCRFVKVLHILIVIRSNDMIHRGYFAAVERIINSFALPTITERAWNIAVHCSVWTQSCYTELPCKELWSLNFGSCSGSAEMKEPLRGKVLKSALQNNFPKIITLKGKKKRKEQHPSHSILILLRLEE